MRARWCRCWRRRKPALCRIRCAVAETCDGRAEAPAPKNRRASKLKATNAPRARTRAAQEVVVNDARQRQIKQEWHKTLAACACTVRRECGATFDWKAGARGGGARDAARHQLLATNSPSFPSPRGPIIPGY